MKSLFWLQIWSSAFKFESMRSEELGGGMLFSLQSERAGLVGCPVGPEIRGVLRYLVCWLL